MTSADRRRARRGFTLIEVSVTLVLSVLMLYALHATVRSSLASRRATARAYRVNQIAQDLLYRLLELPFGKPADPAPAGAQLTELFDDDQDFGTITLHQVAVPPDDEGHVFRIASEGVSGTWRVRVTADLDGDGELTGPREGRPDLVRIEIFFDERLVRDTMRAADPGFTTLDTGARYLK